MGNKNDYWGRLNEGIILNLFTNHSIESLQLAVPEIKGIMDYNSIFSRNIFRYDDTLSTIYLNIRNEINCDGMFKIIKTKITFPLNFFNEKQEKENLDVQDNFIPTLNFLYLKEGNLFSANGKEFISFDFSVIFKRKLSKIT